MKQMMPYIILIGVITTLSASVGIALSILKPDLLGRSSVSASTAADSTKADSLHHELVKQDSVKPQPIQQVETKQIAWKDTVGALRKQLEAQQKKIAEYEQRETKQTAAVDSAKMKRRAQFTKLMESMSAEEAAKVLANMDDDDVKEILLNVKARQAGKILGMLEPRRAARLMN